MTAAVAPLPQLHDANDSPALARKRRREILLSQRACAPDLSFSVVTEEITSSQKKRKISHEVSEESDSSDAKPRKKVAKKKAAAIKKPQMKYDPDVPMSKEEAAAWRREQRRKRNRESAAASRQRQRDRIVELEIVLDEWKSKFDVVLERIQKLEEITQISVTADLLTEIAAAPPQSIVSPVSSPNFSPCQSPSVSPVASCSFLDAGKVKAESDLKVHQVEEEEEQLLNKMISRPAVKIAGAASLLPEDSMMLPAALCPDPCESSKMNKSEPDPMVEAKPTGLLLPDLEDEFGEFLLDAVTWL